MAPKKADGGVDFDKLPPPPQTRSFWQANPDKVRRALPPFLSEADKQALCEHESVMLVYDVQFDPTAEYQNRPAPRWELSVIIPDWDDAKHTLTLSPNETRDALMHAFEDWVQVPDNPPIAVRMAKIVPRNGNPFYALDAVQDYVPEEDVPY